MTSTDGRDEFAMELTTSLAAIAPAGVDVGARAISPSDAHRLEPAERALTRAMSSTRLFEFASGRRLLHDLTGSREAIERARNGSPLLAPGVVGSLAHDRRHAVAAVSRRRDLRAIGIDLEPADQELSGEEASIIVRRDDHVPDALTAFVVKEAVYKAWSFLGGTILDHHDVRIDRVDDDFTATVLIDPPSTAVPCRFVGRLSRTQMHLLSLVVVSNEQE